VVGVPAGCTQGAGTAMAAWLDRGVYTAGYTSPDYSRKSEKSQEESKLARNQGGRTVGLDRRSPTLRGLFKSPTTLS